MAWEIARRLLQQGIQDGSRTTVVTMLGWMAATLASCMLGSVAVHAPAWMQIFVAIMFGVDFFVFIAAYIFFGITDKDALRSEKYSIQKLAIEHHLLGDRDAGLFDPSAVNTTPLQISAAKGQGL